jgi:hypothetical protein
MALFSSLFGGGPRRRDVRETTNEELDAILVPVRDQVVEFKDRTQVSYTHILPAAHDIGVRLLVQARGLESVRRLYSAMLDDMDSRGAIPVRSHLDINKPPIAPEHLAELNGMLWKVANQMIAKGHPVEHVAQAYTSFAMMVGGRIASGDPWLVKYMMAQVFRDLSSDEYGQSDARPSPDQAAKVDEPLQPPADMDEPIKLLFCQFRDCTYLFKDKSGLDWEHLLPGIQRAAIIHFIKDRGRKLTIELLQKQIQTIDRSLQNAVPKSFPERPITPLHITNMAKFNELILEIAAFDYPQFFTRWQQQIQC